VSALQALSRRAAAAWAAWAARATAARRSRREKALAAAFRRVRRSPRRLADLRRALRAWRSDAAAHAPSGASGPGRAASLVPPLILGPSGPGPVLPGPAAGNNTGASREGRAAASTSSDDSDTAREFMGHVHASGSSLRAGPSGPEMQAGPPPTSAGGPTNGAGTCRARVGDVFRASSRACIRRGRGRQEGAAEGCRYGAGGDGAESGPGPGGGPGQMDGAGGGVDGDGGGGEVRAAVAWLSDDA
jgi:hypothetical protein